MASPDYLGSTFINHKVDETFDIMTRKAAYRKFPHISTLIPFDDQRGIIGPQSWMQKMGLAPKMGMVGYGGGPGVAGGG